MSHTVMIDLDEVGALVRDNLDLALPHLTAQVHVNPQAALKTVIAQWSYCDLILRNLDPKYELEVERFETLRRECRGLINQFWAAYSLLPIQRSNGQTVLAQPVEESEQPRKYTIRHVNGGGKGRPGRPKKQRVNLSPEQRVEIKHYLGNLGRKPTQADYDEVAQIYGINPNTAWKIWSDWTDKRGTH